MKDWFIAGLVLLLVPGAAMAAESPYAGLEARQIKALSPAQVDDLRAGRGMGMALAAELNNYPGPRHVLDLSARIGLSADQHKRVSELFEEMAAGAKELGARIVEAERQLDTLFARKRADKSILRSRTADIAKLNGRLRYLHLRYHVDVRALLSDAQIAQYGQLRGYANSRGGHGGAMGSHHEPGQRK